MVTVKFSDRAYLQKHVRGSAEEDNLMSTFDTIQKNNKEIRKLFKKDFFVPKNVPKNAAVSGT